jgi:hypothetical protein
MAKHWRFSGKSRRRSLQAAPYCWRRGWIAELSERSSSASIRRPISRIAPISRKCWCIAPRAGAGSARRYGRWLLVLDTVPGDNGHRVYKRAGWTQSGIIPDYALFPDGRLCDTAVMWKRLDK